MRILSQVESDDQLTITTDDIGSVIIPIEAIENRMRFYGLSTPEAAVQAILREHHERQAGRCGRLARGQSWHDLTPQERGQITGGLADVEVAEVKLSETVRDEVQALRTRQLASRQHATTARDATALSDTPGRAESSVEGA